MNVFDVLSEDHRRVATIFEKLEATTERALKTREEFFAKLRSELDQHTNLEEDILYRELALFEETRDMVREAFEQHRAVRGLLEELSAFRKDSDRWGAKLLVLRENVERHVLQEESEMFEQARLLLTDAQMDEFGERLQEARKNVTAAARR